MFLVNFVIANGLLNPSDSNPQIPFGFSPNAQDLSTNTNNRTNFEIPDVYTGWYSLPVGTNVGLFSVFFTSPDTGYLAGMNGTILKTTNAGITWTPQNSGTGEFLHSVYFPKANTGYVAGSNGTIIKTTNAGITWTPLNSGTSEFLYSVYFPKTDTGYVAGSNGTILKTIDGGINWTNLYNVPNYNISSVFFTSPNTGYVVGDRVTNLRTTDGGATWNLMPIGITPTLGSVFFSDPYTGYASGQSEEGKGVIFKTIDAGITWDTAYLGPYEDNYYSVCFPDADTGYVVGAWGHILKTTDAGTTWYNQTSGVDYRLNSVFFTDVNTGYIAVGGGIILKTNDGGVPTGFDENNPVSNKLKIYPNPTNKYLTVETADRGSLSVYNLKGMLILRKEIKNNNSTLDVSNLQNGIYIVKVVGDRQVYLGKFIRQD